MDFFGAGSQVAERMGLLDRLCSQQIALDGIAYVNAQGKLIAKLDAALVRKITKEKYLFFHKASRTLILDDLIQVHPSVEGKPFRNALLKLEGLPLHRAALDWTSSCLSRIAISHDNRLTSC